MNIRPLHDRIIVHRLEEGEQQIGGIIIPDTAKEKPQQGTVIAVGNGKVNDDGKPIPLDVKAGDRILFGKYAGQEIKLDGEEYLIMKEEDVLAVVHGESKKAPAIIKADSRTATKGKSLIASKAKSKSKGKSPSPSASRSKSKDKNTSKSKSKQRR
jgi:chaperonin GroES